MSARPTSATAPRDVRADMEAEARRVIEGAQSAGVTLRLIGGLGVRTFCRDMRFCERDHSDIDMVGLRRQSRAIRDVFVGLGFSEDRHVRMATLNQQLLFRRSCVHGAGDAGAVHTDDHVDVFLNAFRMDHEIDLRRRLRLADVTVPASDLLLSKLQIFKLSAKDLRDIVTLLKDLDEADDGAPYAIDLAYVAGLCAADWGLFYDVVTNLGRVTERLNEFGLPPADEQRVRRRLARLVGVIDAVPKTVGWHARARIGAHLPWHEDVEEQE
jgi:hypothetical protein